MLYNSNHSRSRVVRPFLWKVDQSLSLWSEYLFCVGFSSRRLFWTAFFLYNKFFTSASQSTAHILERKKLTFLFPFRLSKNDDMEYNVNVSETLSFFWAIRKGQRKVCHGGWDKSGSLGFVKCDIHNLHKLWFLSKRPKLVSNVVPVWGGGESVWV